MLEWIKENLGLVWLAAGSVLLCALTSVAVVVVLVRLPADYFEKQGRAPAPSPAWRVARNLLGWLTILAGLAMLILPGPGAVVILLGVMLAEFPGKRRLERWIISRKSVMSPANWLRSKFSKPPLKVGPSKRPRRLRAASAA